MIEKRKSETDNVRKTGVNDTREEKKEASNVLGLCLPGTSWVRK